LQEITAQGAPDQACDGVTEKSEAVLLGSTRHEMRAQNTRDYLNDEIG
jgi:hypothetical protein